MQERRLSVDHVTVYRWVQSYAAQLEQRARSNCAHPERFMAS